jgi:serine/threonine protein kinase
VAFSLLKKSSAVEPSSPGPFGRFYLQELINSGGMADIWLATDSKGHTHALRRLHNHLRSDRTSKKRFLRGCEVLEKLQDNDFIIGYVEHGKVDGQLYLVMEYLESSNLKQLHAQQDPVLTENIAQILIDMATGLEYVHENSYMHLDFKPENVIVSRNGSVRLVDFDLAQPITGKPHKMKTNPGTPAYMSPEQLQRQPVDHRADIFAFGVTAYELLTQQKPFPGESAAEILELQLSRSNFVAPRELNPDLPANLEKMILKCLATEPDRRYPFMGVLVRDLQSALYV